MMSDINSEIYWEQLAAKGVSIFKILGLISPDSKDYYDSCEILFNRYNINELEDRHNELMKTVSTLETEWYELNYKRKYRSSRYKKIGRVLNKVRDRVIKLSNTLYLGKSSNNRVRS